MHRDDQMRSPRQMSWIVDTLPHQKHQNKTTMSQSCQVKQSHCLLVEEAARGEI